MSINKKEFIKISIKTNGRCFYCNNIGEVIDHFVSKQKYKDWNLTPYIGSPDHIDNLFLACSKCNAQKKDKCPEDFIGNSYRCWNRYERTNERILNLQI